MPASSSVGKMRLKTVIVLLIVCMGGLYIMALGHYTGPGASLSSAAAARAMPSAEGRREGWGAGQPLESAALREKVTTLQAELAGVPDLEAKVAALTADLAAANRALALTRAAESDAEAKQQKAEARADQATAAAAIAVADARKAASATAAARAAAVSAARGAASAAAAGATADAPDVHGCSEASWCSKDLPRTAAGGASAQCLDALVKQCPCACKGAVPTVHRNVAVPAKLRGAAQKQQRPLVLAPGEREEAASPSDGAAAENSAVAAAAAASAVVPSGGQALLYVYPAQFHAEQQYSYFYDEIWRALERSPRRTTDAAKADVFFLGSEHACEFNWPNYTHSPPSVDFIYGDMNSCRSTRQARTRAYIDKYARYLTGPGTDRPQKPGAPMHVIFDMFGYTMKDSKLEPNPQIAWAAPSFNMNEAFNIGRDIGFPAKNLVSFDKAENQASCMDQKKYLLTFKGTIDAVVRGNVAKLHNGKDIQIVTSKFKADCGQKVEGDVEHICGGGLYTDLMSHTTFGAVMRGDNLYSYRYLEVMSAGAIPVIFSDTWVLPFYEVVDYSKFAIVLHEKDWEKLVPMLRAMPADKVCAMRKEAQRVYRKHFADFDGIMETTMLVFDARKQGTTLKPPIDWRAEDQ
jgi:hypothetical protein